MKSTGKKVWLYLYLLEDESPSVYEETKQKLIELGLIQLADRSKKLCMEVSEHRAELEEMLLAGKTPVVATYALANIGSISQSLENLLMFINRIIGQNVRFISVSDHIDSESLTKNFVQALITALGSARQKLRSVMIRRSLYNLKATGTKIGRPKKVDDAKIKKLRASGLTLGEISRKLHVSKGAVQHSLLRVK